MAVGDTALDAATPVRARSKGTVRVFDEGIIVLATRDLRAAETRADLETLGGGNRHHGVAELRLELVEYRLAKSGGDAADDTGDGTTNGVQSLLGADDALKGGKEVRMELKGL